MRKTIAGVLLLAVMLGGSCADSPSGPADGPRLVSVLPAPNAVGVDPATDLVFEFSASMMAGDERQVIVTRAGGTEPLGMHGEWANDGRTLHVHPEMPFEPGTQYAMHVGAMHDREHRALMMCDDMPMDSTGMGGMDRRSGHDGPMERRMNADSCADLQHAMTFVFTTAD